MTNIENPPTQKIHLSSKNIIAVYELLKNTKSKRNNIDLSLKPLQGIYHKNANLTNMCMYTCIIHRISCTTIRLVIIHKEYVISKHVIYLKRNYLETLRNSEGHPKQNLPSQQHATDGKQIPSFHTKGSKIVSQCG